MTNPNNKQTSLKKETKQEVKQQEATVKKDRKLKCDKCEQEFLLKTATGFILMNDKIICASCCGSVPLL